MQYPCTIFEVFAQIPERTPLDCANNKTKHPAYNSIPTTYHHLHPTHGTVAATATGDGAPHSIQDRTEKHYRNGTVEKQVNHSGAPSHIKA